MKEKTDIEKHVASVRTNLLDIHKLLVDFARSDYEKLYGPVQSPGEWLNLLMSNSFFGWLRPLSTLITTIDELLESPIDALNAMAIRSQIENLIVESSTNSDFRSHYLNMIQRSPEVVMAHAKLKEQISQFPQM